jgi:hypothetical protein
MAPLHKGDALMAQQDEFIRQQAEDAARDKAGKGDGARYFDPMAGTVAPLEFTIASSLAGKSAPERPWLIRDWIPSCRFYPQKVQSHTRLRNSKMMQRVRMRNTR